MQGLSLKNSIEIKKDIDYYYDKLERLFFVQTREIPGRFSDGSDIMNFFWENINSVTIQGVIFEVKRLIYRYEPKLDVTAISAGVFPSVDGELLVIEVECFLKEDPTEQRAFTFSKFKDKED